METTEISLSSDNQILRIDGGIVICLVETKGQAARLGIHAPEHVKIVRPESRKKQKSPLQGVS